MMIPAKVLRSLNGFDNRYRAWGYGEDADIVLRGWQAGYRMGLSGFSTTVYHLWHPSNETEVNRALFDETAARNQPRCTDGLDAHFAARTTREGRGCYTRVAYDY